MSYPLLRMFMMLMWCSFDKAENVHPDEGGDPNVEDTECWRYKHKIQCLKTMDVQYTWIL